MKSNELEQVAKGRGATCYVDVCIAAKIEATKKKRKGLTESTISTLQRIARNLRQSTVYHLQGIYTCNTV